MLAFTIYCSSIKKTNKKTMTSLTVDKKKKSFWNSSFLVLTLCIGTAILHTANRIVSKHLSHMNPALYHWFHFLILILLSQPFALCRNTVEDELKIIKNARSILPALVIRSLIATTGGLIFLYSLRVNRYIHVKFVDL